MLAVTGQTLETIRTSYETDRQPETLQEASGYFRQMTQGPLSPRPWTPVGERILRVEDAEGHWLPIEVLSRGAREQLFLSLRLSLAAYFARRGAALPLILDDVLVNFDVERAKAAAQVLRDFAAQGHQMLIFTCHEHIAKLFPQSQGAGQRVAEQSGKERVDPAPLVFDDGLKEKPKKPLRSLPPRRGSQAKPSRLAEMEEPGSWKRRKSPWPNRLLSWQSRNRPGKPRARFEESIEPLGKIWEEE